MKLGLREANQHFSKAIKAVRAGKEVVLTERGQPIAVIKPIKSELAPDAILERMANEGLITLPARRGPLPSPSWKPIRLKGKKLSQTIIDDREARCCARSIQVPVVGTLGVVLKARAQGLVPAARPVIERLLDHGMYLSRQVIDSALAIVGE